MFFDKLFNKGQTHQSLVSTVKVVGGKVVDQFSWQRNGVGGLINEDNSLVGTDVKDLPSDYVMRDQQEEW